MLADRLSCYLMLEQFTWNYLNNQLHRPFHPASLSHPTTLHALDRRLIVIYWNCAWKKPGF